MYMSLQPQMYYTGSRNIQEKGTLSRVFLTALGVGFLGKDHQSHQRYCLAMAGAPPGRLGPSQKGAPVSTTCLQRGAHFPAPIG